jgi:hypothetical protein
MNDLIIILFAASIAVLLLGIVTFTVVLSYHKALKEQRRLSEELEKVKSTGSAEANKIIADAQENANAVIRNSQLKAQEIVKSGDIFSQEYKQKFQASLLQLIELEKKQYEQIATGVQAESTKMLAAMSSGLNTQVESEMKTFHTTMTQETSKVRDALSKGIQGAYREVHSQVEEYKAQMIAQVNSVMFKIVSDATKKSLGEALSREQHEKIIVKALEEAKKQNVF